MRYRMTHADGTQVDAALTDEQAAAMASEHPRPLATYRCTRGNERHWGEHTEAEVAALAVEGWTCEVGEAWPPEPLDIAAIQAADHLARARQLLADPDCREAVAEVLARVQAVAALGVDISDWSFQGVTAAAEARAAATEIPTRLDVLTAAMALRTAWDRLVYHAGTMRVADELWPALYDLTTGG